MSYGALKRLEVVERMHQYLYLSILYNALLLTTSHVSLHATKKAPSLGGWFP